MVDQRFAVSLHIMALLAFEECQEGPLSTSERLAKSIGTNPTVVRRQVARLVDAKLLKAYKGKNGGIELAKSPKEITMNEIYTAAVDSPLLSKSDKAPRKHCPVSCSMGQLMEELIDGVERNTRKYLSGITLSEFVSKIS